jgi:hypothetical protein
MLMITDAAWERLSQLQSTRPNIAKFRLTHDDGRVKCHRGKQKTDDRVVEHTGSPTLIMTPDVAKTLSERTLDAPETKNGRRLQLKQISG